LYCYEKTDQLELFVWRWKDVSRADINARLKEFKKFDLNKTGELEENHTMMLLESRGETKTAVELRAMVAEIDMDHNHTVNFLEWCCAIYNKSWEDTNNFADDDARLAAMEEAKKAGEKAAAAKAAIDAASASDVEAATRHANELEAEKGLVSRTVVQYLECVMLL
jgi:2-hydroxychromene-2-carboxylate isomerase